MSKNMSENTNIDMDNDDLPVGRVHSRREILALFGVSGAALMAGGFAVRAASGGDDTAVLAQSAATTRDASDALSASRRRSAPKARTSSMRSSIAPTSASIRQTGR